MGGPVLDLTLAALHHLLAFGIAATVTAELVLVRPGLAAASLRLLGRYDAAYGLLALALLVVGILRVNFGAKGADFYLHNHVFWTKMALFGVMGLLSIRPTLRILGWQKALRADAGFTPPATEIASVRRLLMAEIHVFALIPIAAAAMARGVGYAG
jgi:putative membrane protein